MKLNSLPISVVAAIIIGIAQMWLLTYCWAFIAIYSPVMTWVLNLGVRGAAFYAIIYSLDFLVNISLCIPAAYAICKLRPKKLSLYSILAVLPAFVWLNKLLISEPFRLNQFVAWYSYVPGWIYELVSIPVAVLIIHRITGRSSMFHQQAGSTGRSSATPLN